jgi:hypothetical protein
MRPVAVTVREHVPHRMLWQTRPVLFTEISDQWRELGRWWEGEAECEYFLGETARGLFLLCHQLQPDSWHAKPVL